MNHSMTATPQTGTSSEFSESALLQSAVEFHGGGQYGVARQLYLQILEQNPGHEIAWHNLGLVEHMTGRHAQAAEYILVVEDADSSGSGPAVQWLVYHIPRNVTSLPANASATGGPFAQGKNYKGKIGYVGPDVSSGKPHRFFFQVFAIDMPLKLDAGADLPALKQSFDGTVLCTGQLIGTSGPQ